MVPSAITTMVLGGSSAGFALPGAASGSAASPVSGETAWSVPFIVGGATTASGGLTLLLVGISDPATHADAGRARVAAGGMVLSLGAGMGVAGISAIALGSEDLDATAMFVTGLTTSALGVPFVIWGASTWDEDRGNDYASKGRIVAGLIVTSAAIVATMGGVYAAAWSDDASGRGGAWAGSGAAVASVPLLILGSAGLGAGIPVLAAGADVIDERYAVPDITVGPTSMQATWTLR